MAERSKETERHLAEIDDIYGDLAGVLGSQSPQTVARVHGALKHIEKLQGKNPTYLATALYMGLRKKVFNAENLAQILPTITKAVAAEKSPGELGWALLKGMENATFNENLPSLLPVLEKTAAAGHDPFHLAVSFLNGMEIKASNLNVKPFTTENLPQILPVMQQTATAGHDPHYLAEALRVGLATKAFNSDNLNSVLKTASHYIEKGKNPTAFVAALQSKQLPPTPENIQALKEAEPHILRTYDFLHGLETIKEHQTVSAPLFKQVLETYKTKLPQMGEKKYWQWIGLHAKQLKANKTRVKP